MYYTFSMSESNINSSLLSTPNIDLTPNELRPIFDDIMSDQENKIDQVENTECNKIEKVKLNLRATRLDSVDLKVIANSDKSNVKTSKRTERPYSKFANIGKIDSKLRLKFQVDLYDQLISVSTAECQLNKFISNVDSWICENNTDNLKYTLAHRNTIDILKKTPALRERIANNLITPEEFVGLLSNKRTAASKSLLERKQRQQKNHKTNCKRRSHSTRLIYCNPTTFQL